MSEQIDISRVARLARITLSAEELAEYEAQLPAIIEHAARVQALPTEGVEPTSHPLPIVNVFRPDEAGESLDREEVLSQAPERQDDLFVVPRILDEA
jgi:aspartyl-tRNA(Asn)/glutamyl-tRNA(Gln) amidotransferase subunit C